MQNPKSTLMS